MKNLGNHCCCGASEFSRYSRGCTWNVIYG